MNLSTVLIFCHSCSAIFEPLDGTLSCPSCGDGTSPVTSPKLPFNFNWFAATPKTFYFATPDGWHTEVQLSWNGDFQVSDTPPSNIGGEHAIEVDVGDATFLKAEGLDQLLFAAFTHKFVFAFSLIDRHLVSAKVASSPYVRPGGTSL